MKRIYIKPVMEDLTCESDGFLCASDYHWNFTGGGGSGGDGRPKADGGGAREFSDEFFEEDYDEY